MQNVYQATAAPVASRVPAHPAKNNDWLVWLMGIGIVLIIFPFLAAGAGLIIYEKTNRILPGVYAGPVDLGSLNEADAAEQIDQFWNQAAYFVVSQGENVWTVTAPNIGLWIDPLATARSAQTVGKGTGGLQQLWQLVQMGGYEIEPLVSFQPDVARDVFTRLSAYVDTPAQDARLEQLPDGRWTAIPGTPGTGLDVDAIVDQIEADPQVALALGSIELPMKPLFPAIADLSTEVSRIETYYQKQLHLFAYDAITDERIRWDMPQALVAAWIKLDDPYGEPYLQVDEAQFQAYLTEWEQTLDGREIQTSDSLESLGDNWLSGGEFEILLRHKPTQYTVGAGENLVSIGARFGFPYWRIQEANPGSSMYSVLAGQVITIPSKNVLLPLPVVPNKRIVISISEQHMYVYENWELRSEHVISTGMSDSPTLPGVFQIQSHEINAYASRWDLYMPHFLGIYEAVPGFWNGIHGLPLLSSGVRLWGNVLGSPASYGCIIMDLQAGEDIYNWAEDGVVVEIVR